MERLDCQPKFNGGISTSATTMRKIQNEATEKCKILESIIKDLRFALEEKDEIISKLTIELKIANYLLKVEETKNIDRVAAITNNQLEKQTIEFTKVLMKLNSEIVVLHEKLNKINSSDSWKPLEANLENQIANINQIKSVPANQCKCVERFQSDQMTNLNSESDRMISLRKKSKFQFLFQELRRSMTKLRKILLKA